MQTESTALEQSFVGKGQSNPHVPTVQLAVSSDPKVLHPALHSLGVVPWRCRWAALHASWMPDPAARDSLACTTSSRLRLCCVLLGGLNVLLLLLLLLPLATQRQPLRMLQLHL